jgi:hypothetical protein
MHPILADELKYLARDENGKATRSMLARFISKKRPKISSMLASEKVTPGAIVEKRLFVG